MNCMEYFTCVMSSVTGNLCNKCPKQLVKQNSYSDYVNAISGFASNSRTPGDPVTFWHPIWGQRLQNCLNCHTAH